MAIGRIHPISESHLSLFTACVLVTADDDVWHGGEQDATEMESNAGVRAFEELGF
jgi:hypothetical protein